MRLAAFITENTDEIVAEWEGFALSLVPADQHMGSLSLRDHIEQLLVFIVQDLNSAQTDAEQVRKSHGDKASAPYPSAAETHASLRYDGGFDMDQMVSEYRALRASIVKLWDATLVEVTRQDLKDLTRFHEAVDQSVAESIRDYTKKLDLSRNLFLGILSHDLRNPLGAISMSAQLATRIGDLSDRQTMLQAQISDSAARASEIVDNLLDLTRARLGSGLPIVRDKMDLGFVSRKLVDEMRVLHPSREFQIKVTGDVGGIWDKARIGQVLSNLLGNAVQYGFRGVPIKVTVEGMPRDVVLCVHNEGIPISADAIRTIFSAMTRAQSNEDTKSKPIATNLGLGLYISRQIVTAHGGSIDVKSSEVDGTAFTVRFPRGDNVDGNAGTATGREP